LKAKIQGAISVLLLVIIGFFTYRFFSPTLSVNRASESIELLKKFETQGVPAFEAPLLSGKIYKNSEASGKVVIVNFWASWCNPCVSEFPSLLKLVENFKGEVVLLAITIDEEKKDIENFLKAFGFREAWVQILRDPEKKISDQFGVKKIPESFLFGRDGKLIRKIVGVEDWYNENSIAYFNQLVKK
jgi:cytochrome c biogenesis protein CcmG/thiol:disulfide interchange protein DsbE